jgi:hypothetical protein
MMVCVDDLEFVARTGEHSLSRILGRASLNMKSIKTEEGSRHSRFSLVVLQSKELYVPWLI